MTRGIRDEQGALLPLRELDVALGEYHGQTLLYEAWEGRMDHKRRNLVAKFFARIPHALRRNAFNIAERFFNETGISKKAA